MLVDISINLQSNVGAIIVSFHLNVYISFSSVIMQTDIKEKVQYLQ